MTFAKACSAGPSCFARIWVMPRKNWTSVSLGLSEAAFRSSGIAFVGDVVFQGSIGRTDLPGGDFRTLMKSIREEVLTLPDETILYTGHGPATTVGRERATNPFLVQHHGGELA